MTSDILEIIKQTAFLTSVLAGFAIAVATQLIAMAQKGRLVSSAIATFLISSVVTVSATFVFVFVLTAAILPEGYPMSVTEAWMANFVGGMGVLPMAGLVLFLVGIGLLGWLRSKVLGAITTVSAVLGFVLVVSILRTLSSFQ